MWDILRRSKSCSYDATYIKIWPLDFIKTTSSAITSVQKSSPMKLTNSASHRWKLDGFSLSTMVPYSLKFLYPKTREEKWGMCWSWIFTSGCHDHRREFEVEEARPPNTRMHCRFWMWSPSTLVCGTSRQLWIFSFPWASANPCPRARSGTYVVCKTIRKTCH